MRLSHAIVALSCLLSSALADEASKPEKEKLDPKTAERKVEKARRDIDLARLELRIAQLDARIEQNSAKDALYAAERKLEQAKRDLEHFRTAEAKVDLEKARIRLDRSANRAEQAKDELAELVAMYDAEEFAEMTKELVLKRGRQNLELAERDVAVETRAFEMIQDHDHPRKLRELEESLRQAQNNLEAGTLKLEKAELKAEHSLQKARDRIHELELDHETATTELEKARAGDSEEAGRP